MTVSGISPSACQNTVILGFSSESSPAQGSWHWGVSLVQASYKQNRITCVTMFEKKKDLFLRLVFEERKLNTSLQSNFIPTFSYKVQNYFFSRDCWYGVVSKLGK